MPTEQVEKVQQTFETFQLQGRHVNVEITNDQKSGGGGRKSRKPRKKFDGDK